MGSCGQANYPNDHRGEKAKRERQADKRINRQKRNRETDRQTNRSTNRQTDILFSLISE
jgi:hypothetical protein